MRGPDPRIHADAPMRSPSDPSTFNGRMNCRVKPGNEAKDYALRTQGLTSPRSIFSKLAPRSIAD
jgi:hypothetical protein